MKINGKEYKMVEIIQITMGFIGANVACFFLAMVLMELWGV